MPGASLARGNWRQGHVCRPRFRAARVVIVNSGASYWLHGARMEWSLLGSCCAIASTLAVRVLMECSLSPSLSL